MVPWPRNEHGAIAGLKTTSYAENVVALAYAAERDAAEAIFANTAGNLCEGTGTNVFCVFGEEVVTPPLSARLPRRRDPQPGGRVVRRRTSATSRWTEFAAADEVFLTSTTRDVQSVHTRRRPGDAAGDAGHRGASPPSGASASRTTSTRLADCRDPRRRDRQLAASGWVVEQSGRRAWRRRACRPTVRPVEQAAGRPEAGVLAPVRWSAAVAVRWRRSAPPSPSRPGRV